MNFSEPRKALLRLLSDGGFHSGAELAKTLNLSRTSVWAMIHELEQIGLEVDAVSGKGYRLARPLELLSEEAIMQTLSVAAREMIAGMEIHDEIDSTNTYLMTRAAEGAAIGTVCLAEYQTAGRGRIGRSWQSPFAGNICLSLLWRFDGHAAVAGLSLAVGVAVIRALHRLGIEDLGLKWPNDVLWQQRKLGGILLEVHGEAHGRCAVVVGIGINVHLPAEAAMAIDQDWVDLGQIQAGKPQSRNHLIAYVLEELLKLLVDYPQHGLRIIIEQWRQWHCYQGRKVVLHLGGKIIRGRVEGVTDDGLLVLDCEEGGLKEFASGDVRLRLDE